MFICLSIGLAVNIGCVFVSAWSRAAHSAFRTYASPWRRTTENSPAAVAVLVNGHYVLAPDEVVSADRWMLAVTHLYGSHVEWERHTVVLRVFPRARQLVIK